ncbi:cation transporter [Ferruginibacter lapsinanis]|uniref:heavy-metal-associated domain-containing protein n=1 Tax=Ferruginibacter lapsinanis TaxID=563172 RepID=UPI001E5B282E|nr:cation transporter [Ferruginibacter lapsinanis]UEG49700.1 cation transporter [Ferruginibacter lapsinanis]
MKALSIYAVILFSIFNSFTSFAQKGAVANTATIKVWGNCETCKKKIEKAAKNSGAATAVWSEETKELVVTYDGAKTSTERIQQSVAAAGYDTQDFVASDAAYNKLPGCCQYDRKPVTTEEVKKCCNMEKCGKDAAACKEMKCCKDAKCCKEKGCVKGKACCKEHASVTDKSCGQEKSCCTM